MSAIQYIPLHNLSIDETANVRKTGRGAEPSFADSIHEKGIIEPLIVRKNGSGYKVVNGGKRLAALLYIKEKGGQAPDPARNNVSHYVDDGFNVPCIIRQESDVEARDTSLITNIVRSGVHPADEAVAFKELNIGGMSVPSIALRYGIDTKRVHQRLALGGLAPVILAAWRAGTISADTAKAFTLADPKRQEKLYKEFTKDGQGAVREHDVYEALKAYEYDAGRFVTFVGIDAYLKRGGKVTEDLFGTNHVVSNLKLAQQMANEKLDDESKKLVADGWSFAIAEGGVRNLLEYGSVKAEMKPTLEEAERLKHLEAIIYADTGGEDAAREFNRMESAITMRSYTPAQKAKAGCFLSIDSDGMLEIESGYIKPAEKKAAAQAAKLERSAAPKSKTASSPSKPAPEPKELTNALKERLRTQRTQAIKMALVDEAATKTGLPKIAYTIIASQIEPGRFSFMPHEVENKLDALIAAISPRLLNERMRKHFEAADYFGGAPKGFVLKAIAEAINADEARKVGGKKKAEIAKFATANVTKTGWLPTELRTVHYDGPGGKGAKKRRA